MLHKNVLPHETATPSSNLRIMPAPTAGKPHSHLGLLLITFRRCSSFFAEAAVLVMVFGILDYFMLKGRIELHWIVGALAISVGLLAASIVMDFTAQRWTKAHP